MDLSYQDAVEFVRRMGFEKEVARFQREEDSGLKIKELERIEKRIQEIIREKKRVRDRLPYLELISMGLIDPDQSELDPKLEPIQEWFLKNARVEDYTCQKGTLINKHGLQEEVVTTKYLVDYYDLYLICSEESSRWVQSSPYRKTVSFREVFVPVKKEILLQEYQQLEKNNSQKNQDRFHDLLSRYIHSSIFNSDDIPPMDFFDLDNIYIEEEVEFESL